MLYLFILFLFRWPEYNGHQAVLAFHPLAASEFHYVKAARDVLVPEERNITFSNEIMDLAHEILVLVNRAVLLHQRNKFTGLKGLLPIIMCTVGVVVVSFLCILSSKVDSKLLLVIRSAPVICWLSPLP